MPSGDKYYVSVCFNTSGNPCEERYSFKFKNLEIEVVRGKEDDGHEMYIETTQENYDATHSSAREFLSELCWYYKVETNVLTYGGGSSKTRFLVQPRKFYRVGNGLDPSRYHSIDFNEAQRLALGLYKEAYSTDNVYYSFLNYYRIVESIKKKKKTEIWIPNSLPSVRRELPDHLVGKTDAEISTHLYQSGRCAVAHAGGGKVANPDDFQDYNRLSSELRLIKALAEKCMIEELLIPTRWEMQARGARKDFFAAFPKLSGVALLAKSVASEDLPLPIPVQIRFVGDANAYSIFDDAKLKISSIKDGRCSMHVSTKHIEFGIQYSFENEKIESQLDSALFEITEKIDAPKEKQLYSLMALKRLLKNGAVLISSGLSCVLQMPSYLPMNMRINWNKIDERIKELAS